MCKYDERCRDGWAPSSDGNGYVICECIREEKMKYYFKFTNTPQKYFQRLSGLKDQPIWNGLGTKVSYKKAIETMVSSRENIEEMIKDEVRIVLRGSTGSGKTQFAVTLALEILATFDLQEKEEPNTFYFLPTNQIKLNAFNDDAIKEMIGNIKKAKVLILDDLTHEVEISNGLTPHVMEKLNTIIRSFDGIIIMTTNYMEDLRSFYEEIKIYDKKNNETITLNEQRIASVLITNQPEGHREYNTKYYTISTPPDRENRKKKNTNINIL